MFCLGLRVCFFGSSSGAFPQQPKGEAAQEHGSFAGGPGPLQEIGGNRLGLARLDILQKDQLLHFPSEK